MRWAALAVLMQAGFAQQLAIGTLLVATRKSHDPDLKQSVILVVHYGTEGVIGLMVNHPSTPSTFFGGPIPLGVRTLVRSQTKPDASEPVCNGVYMLSGTINQKTARIYAGYAGWSIQQLKDEIARGLWSIRPGEAKLVFDPQPATLWSRLVR